MSFLSLSLPRRTVLMLPVFVATGVALAGCSSDEVSVDDSMDATIEPTPQGVGSTTTASAVDVSGWLSREAVVRGVSVSVSVAPLIRVDKSTTLLAMQVTLGAYVDEIPVLANVWGRAGIGDWSCEGVVVFDADGRHVWANTRTTRVDLPTKAGATGLALMTFGDVDTDSPVVMVPQVGFFRPQVVDASQASSVLGDVDLVSLVEEAEVDSALVEPVALEVYTEALDAAGDARTDEESVTVNVSGDVSFEVDSAALTAEAESVLQGVADTIGEYSGGSLSVTGHTDDVADEAYNQTLSEERAQAVAGRLGELTSLSGWEVAVTGKGESEPRAQGTSDEARAANRRVEIVITPTGGTTSGSQTDLSSSDDLPETSGPIGTGAEGVDASDAGTNAHIELASVERVGGLLLAELTLIGAESTGGYIGSAWVRAREHVFSTVRGEKANGTLLVGAADGVTILSGGQRWYPVDYLLPTQEAHVPLAELVLSQALPVGRVTTACVVIPDPGEDVLVVDHQDLGTSASFAWRLTDVAVVDA